MGFLASLPAEGAIINMGLLMEFFLEEAIPKLGAVVALAVGGFFAFLIVKVALNWARSALKG
jgi:hypothetical protein